MSIFRDADHFYECVGELLDRAKKDAQISAKIAKSGMIIQFRYTEPDAVNTINARDKPSQPGAYIDVIHGPCDLKPDIILTMKADFSHAFWRGRVNPAAALANKEILTQGPMPKILKLLPAVQPMYKMYVDLLREKGYEYMLLK